MAVTSAMGQDRVILTRSLKTIMFARRNPRLYIFGGYRLQMGDVQLLRSPLDVLMASEHGITNCVAFLTEKTSVEQLFYLSKFLEDRKLESIILI